MKTQQKCKTKCVEREKVYFSHWAHTTYKITHCIILYFFFRFVWSGRPIHNARRRQSLIESATTRIQGRFGGGVRRRESRWTQDVSAFWPWAARAFRTSDTGGGVGRQLIVDGVRNGRRPGLTLLIPFRPAIFICLLTSALGQFLPPITSYAVARRVSFSVPPWAVRLAAKPSVMQSVSVPTKPHDGQKPGTSGLRKAVRVFQGPNYTENFVQAVLSAVQPSVVGSTLVVGGDGRYFCPQAVDLIIKIAAANGVRFSLKHRPLCIFYEISSA